MATDARLAALEEAIESARRAAFSIGAGKPKLLKAANARIRALRMEAARLRGTHTHAQWMEMVNRFGGRCVRCGTKPEKLQKDHVLPVYLGGSDGIDNLQPLCQRCNCTKVSESFNWANYRANHGFEVIS